MPVDYRPNLTGTRKRRIHLGTLSEKDACKFILGHIKKLVSDEIKKPKLSLEKKIQKIVRIIIEQFDNSISDELIEFCIKSIVIEVERELKKQKKQKIAVPTSPIPIMPEVTIPCPKPSPNPEPSIPNPCPWYPNEKWDKIDWGKWDTKYSSMTDEEMDRDNKKSYENRWPLWKGYCNL